MLIFLDSSIFCSDFHLSSTYFELLKAFVTKGGNWICFSEIVTDEVKNKYKEKIKSQVQKANFEIRELNKIFYIETPLISEESIKGELKRYDDFWDILPLEYGYGSTENYPTILHRDVVQRALERKKPFKEDGKDGYRDYLIWMTFLNAVSHYKTEEACFVTLNSRDFSDPINKDDLHIQLKKDVESTGISLERIHYFTSLKDFVEKKVKPSLHVIALHEDLVEKLRTDKLGFMQPLEDELIKKVIGAELNKFDIVFMEPGDNPTIVSIDEVSEMEIEDVSEMSKTEILLNIRVHALANISFCILKSDYNIMEDRSQMFILDNNWKNQYVLAETPMELVISIEVIFDIERKNIKSIDVEGIEDAFADCPYCPY
jgi:hypothetical protein